MKRLDTRAWTDKIPLLRAGDLVLLTGPILTARDAAHKRLVKALLEGRPLPVDVTGQIIYYTGPCPAPPGWAIGPAGPTTSGRMDAYTPALLDAGLKGMLGKGLRNSEVIESMVKNGCVYFVATGGAGALLSRRIARAEAVAYEDLGPEAVYRLHVEDFPVIVAIDSKGTDLYRDGVKKYRTSTARRGGFADGVER